MNAVRSLLFALAFYLWTAFLCFALLWMLLLPRRRMVAVVRWYLGTVAWLERVVLRLDHVVIGRDKLPAGGGYIIAAKHQSAWETMQLHLIFDDPAIVLKRELMSIPIWGWYARKAGMIPIDRGSPTAALRSMVRNAQPVIDEQRPIVIFPQGTRTAPGAKAPYRAGVAMLYDKARIPVVPVALNSGLFWPRRSFGKKPGTITVEILDPIPAGLPRAAMMERLETALEAASDRLLAEAAPR
jgi:1-acyl-sn-glycerol-3-phosphate acyltransferase